VCGARARVFVRACCGYRYCEYCEYGNQRLKALPASIGHLVGLRTIQITGMYALERLPDDLSKLTGLSNLEIGDCGSECRQSRKMLSASIGDIMVKLTNLQVLSLRRVNIQELPAGMGMLTKLQVLVLEDLDISSPKLRKLPNGIGDLRSLTNLSLSRMQALRRLPASIMHLTRLQQLSIEWCGLKKMPNIQSLTALDTLVLNVSDYNRSCQVYQVLMCSLTTY